MTEELYQIDSYMQEFDAVVTVADGQAVTLDRTAFYPGGGGQPNDLGTLTWAGRIAQVAPRRWCRSRSRPARYGTP